jgi:hypothetical protein
MNTLEQLVAFLPALWLFALYVSPAWSSVIGTVWIVGRVLYSIGTRGPRDSVPAVSRLVRRRLPCCGSELFGAWSLRCCAVEAPV